jgi:hypothetical protein
MFLNRKYPGRKSTCIDEGAMTPSELFGVAVRILGLWFIASAVASAAAVLVAPAAIIGLAANAIVGAILLFGADGFARTAYGGSRARNLSISD